MKGFFKHIVIFFFGLIIFMALINSDKHWKWESS